MVSSPGFSTLASFGTIVCVVSHHPNSEGRLTRIHFKCKSESRKTPSLLDDVDLGKAIQSRSRAHYILFSFFLGSAECV